MPTLPEIYRQDPILAASELPDTSGNARDRLELLETLGEEAPDATTDMGPRAPYPRAATFPDTLPCKTEGDIVARFALTSDLHIGYGNRDHSFSTLASMKTVTAFNALAALAPDLDALLIAGDLNYKNDSKEFQEWQKTIIPAYSSAFCKSETMPSLQLVIGNHDFWWYSQNKFESYYGGLIEELLVPKGYPIFGDADYGQKQNTTIEINGITIIKLCGAEDISDTTIANVNTHHYTWQFEFLRDALAEAAEKRPDLPIIVMAHHGLPGLRISKDTYGDFGKGTSRDMIALMQRYPQVLFISGHVHNPLTHPSVITQDLGFTCLYTGTLGSYYSDEFELSGRAVLKQSKLSSNGMILDIRSDGMATIYRLDFETMQIIRDTICFFPAQAKYGELSTATRRLLSSGPRFPADSRISQPNDRQISFPQATLRDNGLTVSDNDFAYYYRIKFVDPDTGLSRSGSDLLTRSDYHHTNMDPIFSLSGQSGPADNYLITPYNPYDIPGRPLYNNSGFQVYSFSGADRFETSVLCSMALAERSETVIIANGLAFPDALSATSLAGLYRAPLLFADPNGLPTVCKNELVRLGATSAILVGATATALKVKRDLLELGIPQAQIIHHAGQNRFDTMHQVSAEGNSWGPLAIITNGFDFPEACCAASIACATKAPIFMTNRFGIIDTQSRDLLSVGGFTTFLLIGGHHQISPRLEHELKSLHGVDCVVRLAGRDRYETSLQVAVWAINRGLLDCTTIGVATGRDFADALVGGLLQGLSGSVLLLSDPGYDHYLRTRASCLITMPEQIRYFGGSKALPAKLRRKLKKLLL